MIDLLQAFIWYPIQFIEERKMSTYQTGLPLKVYRVYEQAVLENDKKILTRKCSSFSYSRRPSHLANMSDNKKLVMLSCKFLPRFVLLTSPFSNRITANSLNRIHAAGLAENMI